MNVSACKYVLYSHSGNQQNETLDSLPLTGVPCLTLESLPYAGVLALHWSPCLTLESLPYTGVIALHWSHCLTLESLPTGNLSYLNYISCPESTFHCMNASVSEWICEWMKLWGDESEREWLWGIEMWGNGSVREWICNRMNLWGIESGRTWIWEGMNLGGND